MPDIPPNMGMRIVSTAGQHQNAAGQMRGRNPPSPPREYAANGDVRTLKIGRTPWQPGETGTPLFDIVR